MKSFCVGVSRGDFHQGEGDWSRLGGREILASRTGVEPRGAGVPAVKEKGPIVIQENLAAWIARYRTLRTQGNAYWTFNGRARLSWSSEPYQS